MFKELFENAELVGNIGVMVTISALFIYIFYAQYKFMMKNFGKFFDNIMENQKILLQNNESNNISAIQHIEDVKNKNHMDNLNLRMQITPKINEKLKDICLKYHAQRCCILEFHNSNSNFNGIPFAKYSVTFEHLTIGVRPIMPYHINIGFSAIANIVHNVMNNGYEIVVNNEEFQTKCPLIKGMTNMSRTQAMVYIGLFDSSNNLFGLLVLEYPNDISEYVNDEDKHKHRIHDLITEAVSLSTLLNLTPYQNC